MSIDYISNLHAPDLRPYFKHLHWREMGHSFGHLVASDWADKADDDPVFGLYKKCGLWTRDEAAILYQIARRVPGTWLDIGSHTGWTAAHILAAGADDVWAVDPMYTMVAFVERATSQAKLIPAPFTSKYFFERSMQGALSARLYAGIVIDGDHQPGLPLQDAQHAVLFLEPGGVIVFHDFIGEPVREAVAHLIDECGFMCRIYLTPHVVAVCWRGQSADDPSEFHPPMHIPEAGIVEQQLFKRWPERDWGEYK